MPNSSTVPVDTGRSPVAARTSVDLPEPLAPSSATNSPLSTSRWRRELARRAVRDALDALRRRIEAGEGVDVPDARALAEQVRAQLDAWARPRPRRVLNATGVVLHTNLGRAPLSRAAIDAMADAAGSCDLEVGLDDGKRGSRFVWLRPLMAAVIGAEDRFMHANLFYPIHQAAGNEEVIQPPSNVA